MAYHDMLTDLPNRRLFIEKLIQSLKIAERYKWKMVVMYLDMDKFKQINDTFGHDVGDELLQQFAGRVKGCLRESDILARQGGDEFTIFLPDIREEDDAIEIANRMIHSLQEPWQINGHQFHTTCSIGMAFYPKNGKTVDELMKSSDIALYQAKEAGGNNYKIYSSENNEGNENIQNCL
jgi:diguanylate cyclase (GGDEF)-like protein